MKLLATIVLLFNTMTMASTEVMVSKKYNPNCKYNEESGSIVEVDNITEYTEKATYVAIYVTSDGKLSSADSSDVQNISRQLGGGKIYLEKRIHSDNTTEISKTFSINEVVPLKSEAMQSTDLIKHDIAIAIIPELPYQPKTPEEIEQSRINTGYVWIAVASIGTIFAITQSVK